MSAHVDANESRKLPYERPTLTEYGALEDLTAGGTGHSNESSSGVKPRP